MYAPPFFAVADTAEMLAFAGERAFGTVVVADPSGMQASHVPFLVRGSNQDDAIVRFHVARPNPIHRAIEEGHQILLIVAGADAYVSPDWYVAENQVPTWNYTAVHLEGVGRILSSEETKTMVDDLSAVHERLLLPKKPWTSDKMDPARLAAMLRAIVGIEMTITAANGTRKLSQNKGMEDRAGAIEAMRRLPDPGAAAIAHLMEKLPEN